MFDRIAPPASGSLSLLYVQMPVDVMRGLSAPMGSDVLVETPECNFRPTLGLDGLIA
jgi:hypothetical protein